MYTKNVLNKEDYCCDSVIHMLLQMKSAGTHLSAFLSGTQFLLLYYISYIYIIFCFDLFTFIFFSSLIVSSYSHSFVMILITIILCKACTPLCQVHSQVVLPTINGCCIPKI